MSKVSGVIIAKNEEVMIEDALLSLSFCDEIIVINNASKDKTKELALEKDAKVFDISSNDFSELRSLGLSRATNEWILYIDADERLDEELKASIKKILLDGSNYSAFFLKRKNFYLGKNEWPNIEKIQRFFKKDKLKNWKGKLHESPVIEGETGVLDGFLLHFTHRDLSSMLNKTIEWSSVEALLRYNLGHPRITWWRFPRVMITAFLDSYILKKGFRAGAVGIIESIYQSFSMFITYAKLWELQKNSETKSK